HVAAAAVDGYTLLVWKQRVIRDAEKRLLPRVDERPREPLLPRHGIELRRKRGVVGVDDLAAAVLRDRDDAPVVVADGVLDVPGVDADAPVERRGHRAD